MRMRLESEGLGSECGLKALDGALRPSTDALLRKMDRWQMNRH